MAPVLADSLAHRATRLASDPIVGTGHTEGWDEKRRGGSGCEAGGHRRQAFGTFPVGGADPPKTAGVTCCVGADGVGGTPSGPLSYPGIPDQARISIGASVRAVLAASVAP